VDICPQKAAQRTSVMTLGSPGLRDIEGLVLLEMHGERTPALDAIPASNSGLRGPASPLHTAVPKVTSPCHFHNLLPDPPVFLSPSASPGLPQIAAHHQAGLLAQESQVTGSNPDSATELQPRPRLPEPQFPWVSVQEIQVRVIMGTTWNCHRGSCPSLWPGPTASDSGATPKQLGDPHKCLRGGV
jgi:hypothetical protein